MTKKIYFFLLFLSITAFSGIVKSQTPYYHQNDTLVMNEDDLVNFLKQLATGVRNMGETAGIYRNQNLSVSQNDAYVKYRFDKLENTLDNMLWQMGLRQSGGGSRDIILDRATGASTPMYLGNNYANTGRQEIDQLQKQVDLLQQQIGLLTAKLADENTKSQMGEISKELSLLRNGINQQGVPAIAGVSTQLAPNDETQPKPAELRKDTVIVQKKEVEKFDLYKRQIFFESASTKLTTEAQRTLRGVAEVLKENPDLNVKIIGYASPDGKKALNNALSAKRAETAKNLLVSCGINGKRIGIQQAGVDSVSDMKSYARRADIVLENNK